MLIRIALCSLTSLAASPAAAQCPLQELVVHRPATNRQLGQSADLDGDVAVMGAPDISPHEAYVFERDAGGPDNWGQVARLSHPVYISSTGFGQTVAVSGNTIVAGAPFKDDGSAWVFERDAGGPGAWGLTAELIPSDVAPGVQYGDAVDLEGDRAVVGRTYFNTTEDAVFVFERQAGVWNEVAKLTVSEPTSGLFGFSLALCGDRLLVGTDYNEKAFLFERDSSGTWNLSRTFVDAAAPATLYTGFSWSVALTDTYAAIGQPSWGVQGIGTPKDLGAVHIFERDLGGPDNWGHYGRLTEPLQAKGNEYGKGLSLDGEQLAVGSPYNSEVATDRGAVYLYERQGGAWVLTETPEAPSLGSPLVGYDHLGYSVALQGRTLAAGAPFSSGIGSAVFFGEPPTTIYCTAGVSASGCSAAIGVTGAPSATAASGFDLTISGAEGSKRGLFFFGANGRQAAPWGASSSFQCVVPPVARSPLLEENGTTGLCDGAYAFDLNAYIQQKPALNPGAGAVVQAQFWHRDPFATNALKSIMSDAVEFTLCP